MEFERWIDNESWPVYDTLALEMVLQKKKKYSLLLLLQFVLFFFFNMNWRLWLEVHLN
jgi:hypothetical protein